MKKVCSRCKKQLLITNFCKDNTQKDKLHCYCKKCRKEIQNRYNKTKKGKKSNNENNRNWEKRIKMSVFKYYSNGDIKCELCKNTNIHALTVDHIDGGGLKHRREIAKTIGLGGSNFYRWLAKNNFPKGFRVLCRNCNWLEKIIIDKEKSQLMTPSKNSYCRVHCKKYDNKIKLQVIKHYSNNKLECALCGNNEFDVLTVDHINGDGLQHRNREIGGGGSIFYRWLVKNNFPPDYRVLCHNCNWLEYIKNKIFL